MTSGKKMVKMNKIAAELDHIKTVAIAGHVRPDGDCIGSCMGLYLYLKKYYSDLETDIYLEKPREGFSFIEKLEDIQLVCPKDKVYDLIITLDVSSPERIGVADGIFYKAKKSICIDHHISNKGFGDINIICPDVGSSAEVLFGLLDEDKINQTIAAPIYTGMAHDTGIFQYSATTSKTMQIAGKLMDTGIDFNAILDESFNRKSYIQNQILGRCLMESMLILDEKCIVGYIRKKDMSFYGVEAKDLDGIVSQLRITRGVEVAIFLYEMSTQEFKVSMRSNGIVDVNKTATFFGGGGHVRAAGCTMQGSIHDVINNLTCHIEDQLSVENEK